MSELEAMGISVQRGFTDGENVMTQLAFTLPKPTDLQVTFSKEGFTDRLAKIFTNELQTGDEAFDKDVYIRTETPELAATLLGAADLRASIARIVNSGGSIEVDGPFVKLEVAGHQETDDDDTVTLVRALVAG